MFCYSLQIPGGAACWTDQQNYGFIQDWLHWVCKHFWRIKRESERCLWAEWIGRLQPQKYPVCTQLYGEEGQTYCMDERGPGPRPQRCSQDDPSERQIQISPATHKAGVNSTQAVVGIHPRKPPRLPNRSSFCLLLKPSKEAVHEGSTLPGQWTWVFKTR